MHSTNTPDLLLDEEQPDESATGASSNGMNGANGSKREARHPRAFARRLAIAFASVAGVTVALAALLMSVTWSYQFDRYVHANLQAAASGIATIVADSYPQYQFGYNTLTRIPIMGMTSQVGVQVLDLRGNVVYDEASMQRHMESVFEGGNGAVAPQVTPPKIVLSPSGQVVTAPIMVNGRMVGTVRVWAQGTQALLTSRDVQFRRGALMGLAIAALVAIVFAILTGIWYAGRLVRPIERITATAQALRNGETGTRTGLHTDDEIGFLGQAFDAMADAIEADREMERRLTADVAHELRTPLQAIQATVEAMQDGVLPADEERLGIVRDETRRLSRLADGILELTRLERGSVPFDIRRIDAAASVNAAVDSLEALVETCELTLSADVKRGVYVRADRDRLQQAVGNLLSNAARYTPAGGHVDVRLRREPEAAVIEVADTGVGIADEDLPQVFSRFWRADGARATATGGLGIGLAVTKEIVERFGGNISAGPRHDGARGTVFAIRLPLA
jgi:two-component system sensor histidine kinase BaeS